ncbi:MAG: SPW repeat protein [Chloroflexi bacterium]|nr:SPW repeat protein [Chloroflexota bacterium]MCL5959525.1 SPW repeat protein [Chloroflexota bacterium]
MERVSFPNINWVNLVAGIWLIISPFILQYTGVAPAVWNNLAVGILLILVAAYILFTCVKAEWAGWAMAVLGIWEIMSPFVLGYVGEKPALWNNIILGIIIIVVGAWSARSSRPQTGDSR